MGNFQVHPDPYAYYTSLVIHKPLYYDKGLGLWVASSAKAVTAVLTNDLCRVRPATEQVPKALLGSPAADLFRHLVRMNDGERHYAFKQAVSATLASSNAIQAAQHSVGWARFLIDESGPKSLPSQLSRFAFHFAEVRHIWRNHTNPIVFDSPVIEQFFKTIREVNQGLPEGKRLRVLLGDPPSSNQCE